MKTTLLSLFLMTGFAATGLTQPTITEKTAGMEYFEGFFDFWWDAKEGKIWLEIDKLDQEFIYVHSLAAGMGSNDIGLDRGQLGGTKIVRFSRVGPKVLLIEPNYRFRATSDNYLERKSVQEAFAQSVIWGFTVGAEQQGRILVDATDFLMRDAHDVTGRLRSTNQGSFSLDKSRSAIYPEGTFNFPLNSEFEATLTFTGSNAGGWVRSVTPSADAITVRQHHSFVQLPDDGYKPRKNDPRAGYFGIVYQDYSAPIGEEFVKHYISRHRLEKIDPSAAKSEVVKPIVYYLDNGTPEPVRSALLDGARWWAEAFEAAGYTDAYRVEILPADAHPLDVRYNVIQWVHRSTRGWSYGASVRDPRTGEIIKGHVSLGSLRVRQDFLIAEGLLSPYEEGAEPDARMLEMALARIRQLSAHEVGHTLGIAHNFAASVNHRASVMDYPHPQVTILEDGSLDLSEAYATGMGAWDIRAVLYGYQDFPDGVDEETALESILQETIAMDLLYITDSDARPAGGAHPYAHLWDYGTDPVMQLDHILDVRKTALHRLSADAIQTGRPMSSLEDVLVPVYLFHRYQTEATAKLIGGVDFAYTMKGDGQPGPRVVDPEIQRKALELLIKTMHVSELAVPERLLDIISPKPAIVPSSREHFRGYTNPVTDPIAMAETASDLSASLLFNSNRSARLVLQHARNPNYLSLDETIRSVLDASLRLKPLGGYEGAVQRAINTSVMRNLLQLAADERTSPDVQAVTMYHVQSLHKWLLSEQKRTKDVNWKAHYAHLAGWITRLQDHPEAFRLPPAPYTPPGAPIGSYDGDLHAGCGF